MAHVQGIDVAYDSWMDECIAWVSWQIRASAIFAPLATSAQACALAARDICDRAWALAQHDRDVYTNRLNRLRRRPVDSTHAEEWHEHIVHALAALQLTRDQWQAEASGVSLLTTAERDAARTRANLFWESFLHFEDPLTPRQLQHAFNDVHDFQPSAGADSSAAQTQPVAEAAGAQMTDDNVSLDSSMSFGCMAGHAGASGVHETDTDDDLYADASDTSFVQLSAGSPVAEQQGWIICSPEVGEVQLKAEAEFALGAAAPSEAPLRLRKQWWDETTRSVAKFGALARGLLEHFAATERAKICTVPELVTRYNEQQQQFHSSGHRELADLYSLAGLQCDIQCAARRRAAGHDLCTNDLYQDLEDVIDNLQLPLALEGVMRQLLAEPAVFDRVGTPHLRDAVADVNSSTWFQVKDATSVAQATLGARPGMPPADFFFTLAFAPVHEELRMRFFAGGIDLNVEDMCPRVGRTFTSRDKQLDSRIGSPSYVDDPAVLQACAKARDCCKLAEVVVTAVHQVMTARGFVVNYGEGKSTLLFHPIVEGKKVVKAKIAAFKGEMWVPAIQRSVFVADVCRHLGSMVQDSGAMNAELAHRHHTQLGVLGGLKKAVFTRSNDLPVDTRVKYAAAFCHSRVLFHGAVLSALNAGNQKYLETAFMAPLRAAVGLRKQVPEVPPQVQDFYVPYDPYFEGHGWGRYAADSTLVSKVQSSVQGQDLSNSLAYNVLEDLQKGGSISKVEMDLFKSKYKKLHEFVLQTYDNERKFRTRARDLNNKLTAEKIRLEKTTKESQDDQQSIQQLTDQIQEIQSEFEIAQDRDMVLQVQISELEHEKSEKERQLLEREEEIRAAAEPKLRECRDEIKQIQEELEMLRQQESRDQQRLEEYNERCTLIEAETATNKEPAWGLGEPRVLRFEHGRAHDGRAGWFENVSRPRPYPPT
ncbi:unnamed protein product [Prorocentrum cordatum]|uniref:Uncharacterized protein n=1 Tax=Prorocentrum cordatum TaxID=2364126 RepID=A0ABN9Y1G1_9DINO|nr:unnamed protein product [Polarella glacialis]